MVTPLEPLAVLDDVGVTYRDTGAPVHALRGVDLTIHRGETLALLGRSGSGKSTLLQVLGTLTTPTAGRYRLGDVDVGTLDRAARADLRRHRIGFVFQRFHLLPQLDAVDNVALPLRIAGVPRRTRRERATALLDRAGLGDRLDHRPGQLSGGQQQRIAIARALALNPDLLLADEPTGNLDSDNGARVLALLEELAAEGHTLVVVTHDEELARRADRVLRVEDGRLGGAE